MGVAEHAVTALGFWQIWKLGGRHKRGTLLSVFFGGGSGRGKAAGSGFMGQELEQFIRLEAAQETSSDSLTLAHFACVLVVSWAPCMMCSTPAARSALRVKCSSV